MFLILEVTWYNFALNEVEVRMVDILDLKQIDKIIFRLKRVEPVNVKNAF